MATVVVDHTGIHLALSRGEKLAALRRTDITVPWGQVRSAEAVAEPYRLVRGLRAPGLSVPGRTRIGTWRTRGHKSFAVTSKGAPGLRITLRDHADQQILVSTQDSAGLTRQIDARLDPVAAGSADERLVSIPAAGAVLAGTVLLPAAGTPVRAAALLITGSGRVDRDANARGAPIQVSRQIAESLAAAGVATLRFDKRGVGASGGDYLRAGLQDNIDDAAAALAALTGQPACADVPAVVIGHSEGAMIATALAADRTNRLDGVVLLAGPARTGEQTLIWQAAQIAPALPMAARLVLKVLRTTPQQQQRKALDRLKATTADVARLQGVRINAKWMREFLAFDPIPLLAAITAPVLAITGAKDLQVDPADLQVIAATVGGPVTTVLVPDLTHILRRDPEVPSIRHYRRLLRQPVDDAVREHVSDFVVGLAAEVGTVWP